LKLLKSCFLYQNYHIDASKCIDVFKVVWFLPNSNKRRKEEMVIGYLRDLLQDLEDGAHADLSLQSVLKFATGCEEIPVLGFVPQPTIVFLHDDSNHDDPYRTGYPYADMCALVLKLPIIENFERFQQVMCSCLRLCTTFSDI